ncbi:hypothetical protein SJAG_02011 [Schizosaccharomyces japonicus yFS275]|uniref:Putative ER transporter 6TM N-terminal domain-containing protein n=1 Tax=Schizosaccharomyces japonicus (strain yFS275 / FY16936) TaxID=402676 RepID=B6JZH1_SCHJY|nr:hypothetical protein SJAG_02011 [Schizosaccharomyces japonicus yFS275]EEB06939.2 hypothetical protein SJAG_02011 [Schizosaccharomyces japonicus yFS275]
MRAVLGLRNRLSRLVPSRKTTRLLFKPVLALFICEILVLIKPFSKIIGPYAFLIVTIHCLFFPIRQTAGNQLVVVYEGLLGLTVGLIWAVIFKFLAVAANKNGANGAPLLAIGLTMGSFISSYVRSRYGYRIACIIWIFTDCFLMLGDPFGTTVPHTFYYSLTYPSLIAAGVVLLVTFCVPPIQTASDVVVRSAVEYLNECAKCVDVFMSDVKHCSSNSKELDAMAASLLKSLRSKLDTFRTNAAASKFEVSYSYLPVTAYQNFLSHYEKLYTELSSCISSSLSLQRAFRRELNMHIPQRMSTTNSDKPAPFVSPVNDLFMAQHRIQNDIPVQHSAHYSQAKESIDVFFDRFSPTIAALTDFMNKGLAIASSTLKWCNTNEGGEAVTEEKLATLIESISNANLVQKKSVHEALRVALVIRAKSLGKGNSLESSMEIDDLLFSGAFFIFNLSELAIEVRKLLIELYALRSQRAPKKRLFFYSTGVRDLNYSGAFLPVLETPFHNPDSAEDAEDDDAVTSSDYDDMEMITRKTTNSRDPHWKRRMYQWFYILRFRAWRLTRWCAKSKDIQYALKMSIGIGLLSIVAVHGSTAAKYQDWNGQWALISTLFVLEVSVSATLRVGLFRALGTFIGAVFAYVTWEISRGWSYVIAAINFLAAWPAAYVMYLSKFAGVSIVFCITFPPILYGAYLGSSHSAFVLAVTRFLDVMVGITMAVIVNILIFPYVARSRLINELGNASRQLFELYSTLSENMLGNRHYADPELCEQIEQRIQRSLSSARSLLALTGMEFRLKGPFPIHLFASLIGRLERLGNRLLVLNTVRSHFNLGLYHEIVEQVLLYRKDLIATIALTIYILTHSITQKAPVPYFVPSCRNAHFNLREAILKNLLSKVESNSQQQSASNKQNSGRGGLADLSFSDFDTAFGEYDEEAENTLKKIDSNLINAKKTEPLLDEYNGALAYYAECQVIEEIVNDLEFLLQLVKKINGENDVKIWHSNV